MGYISILCLLITAITCTLLIFDQGYHDTLLERVGLSLVSIWAIARLIHKLSVPYSEPVHVILHLGMGCLAVACLCRKYRSKLSLLGKLQQLIH